MENGIVTASKLNQRGSKRNRDRYQQSSAVKQTRVSPAPPAQKKIVQPRPQSDKLPKLSTPSSTILWLSEPSSVVEEALMKDGMEGRWPAMVGI